MCHGMINAQYYPLEQSKVFLLLNPAPEPEQKLGLGQQKGIKKKASQCSPSEVSFSFLFRDLLFESRPSTPAMNHRSKSAQTEIIKKAELS